MLAGVVLAVQVGPAHAEARPPASLAGDAVAAAAALSPWGPSGGPRRSREAAILLAAAAQAGQAVAPGTDLTAVTARAPDGAVLTLGAGDYPGQIVVEGKSLTVIGDPGGQTVLAEPEAQTPVAVGPGGRLVLKNVTFRTRSKDGLAVYVRGGHASVSDCRARETMQPAFYVEGGSLEVARCSVEETRDAGIVAVKSSLVVRESTFSGPSRAGIAVVDGGKAEISGSRFGAFETEGVLADGGSSVVVRDSAFSEVKTGIVLQGGSRGEVTGSRFEAIGEAGVVALGGSEATIAESSFANVGGVGAHVEGGGRLEVSGTQFSGVTGDMISGVGEVSIRVRDSTFEKTENAAVGTSGAKALEVTGSVFREVGLAVAASEGETAVVVAGNTISGLPSEGFAISLETSGPAEVSGNRIVNVGRGIGIIGDRKAPAVVSGNAVVNARHVALYGETRIEGEDAPLRVTGNSLINPGELGVLLHGTPRALLEGNLIVTGTDNGVFLQEGASAVLDGNVVSAAKGAVVAHASAGPGTTFGTDVLLGGVEPKEIAERSLAQSKVAFLLAEGGGEERLRGMADAVLAAASNVQAPADLGGVNEAAAALVQEVDALRARAKTLSTVALRAVDAVGQAFNPEFVVSDDNGEVATAGGNKGPAAIVPPGTYLLQPLFDSTIGEVVTVEAGQAAVAEVTAEDRVVLRFGEQDYKTQQWRITEIPLRAGDRERMRRRLASPSPRKVATRRGGATAEQLEDALELVRGEYDGLFKGYRAASDEFSDAVSGTAFDFAALDQLQKAFDVWGNALDWAHDIFAVAGGESDAQRMVDLARADTFNRFGHLELGARIESRLGILGNGAVAGLLEGDSPELAFQAAVHLHRYGFSAGDAILIAKLGEAKDSSQTLAATRALLDSDDPAVLDGMGAVVRAAVEGMARVEAEHEGKEGPPQYPWNLVNAANSAAPYLLAYGGPEEWRLAARVRFNADGLRTLAGMMDDPRDLVDYFLGLTGARPVQYNVAWLANLCPALRDLPPEVEAEYDRHFLESLTKTAIIKGIGQFGPDIDAKLARWQYNVAKSNCRPNRMAAEFTYSAPDSMKGGRDFYLPDGFTWIPRPWREDGIVENFRNGDPALVGLVEYAPHAKLVEALGDGKAGDGVKYPELFLAYHQVATRACEPDRCAFALRNGEEPAGALAAVVDVRPEFVDRTLRVFLEFDMDAHVHADLATMIGGGPSRTFDAYFASAGKAMVAGVVLRKGGKEIPLAANDDAGGVVYEAALEKPDLTDATLHVELDFFGRTWPLDFDLTASEYARNLRRAETRAVAAAAAAEARPDDPAAWVAWGDVLEQTGRLGAAHEKYEKALALRPDDIDLWLAAADMFVARNMSEPAREILRAAVEANPQSVDLRSALANEHYWAYAYREAAEAYGKAASLEPKNLRWPWWQATSLFLAGERDEAGTLLGSLPEKGRSARTALMLYVVEGLAAGEDAAARDAYLAFLRGLGEEAKDPVVEDIMAGEVAAAAGIVESQKAQLSPDRRCTIGLNAGYRYLVAGDGEQARALFAQAVNTCVVHRLDYRLAKAEMERL